VSRRRVLLVGLDAADGELALRWLREGKLPTLAALAERGTAKPLLSQGEHMPESSWASLITGATPGEHGIYSWRIVRPRTVEQARMASGGWMRPFWSVLRDHAPVKPRTLVFDIPYSGGVEDEGVTQVSGWGLRVTRQGSSWPPGLFEELAARYPAHPAWINRDYDRNPISERRYRRVLRELTERRTQLVLDLFGRTDWDLAVVNYVEPHFAGHAYHHHLEAAQPPSRLARFGATDGLLDLYAEADRGLQKLIDAAGPETDVIVVSTIGMRANETSKDLLGRIMIALGYQVPSQGRSMSRTKATAMLIATKIVPRFLRHRLRKLVPVGTAEAIADRAWGASIDWTRSRAVSEAEPGSAWLRINLEGREPHGVVPAAEREALLAEITAELESLTDAETGEPAVKAVLPMAEIAPGARADQMPDALVSWTPGRRIRAVRHPRVGLIDDGGGPYARSEHNGDGFIVAAGPGIAPGATPPADEVAREIDVAPTVLHLFDCPIPNAVQGRSLDWLLTDVDEEQRAEIDLSAEPAF
jgi:predicted AlkP superfamily phosphohydrolase/phosphomutase